MSSIRVTVVAVLAVAAIVALAVLGPWRQGQSEAIGPDINDDGIVDLSNDIFGVIIAYGQTIPTPTFGGPRRGPECQVLRGISNLSSAVSPPAPAGTLRITLRS